MGKFSILPTNEPTNHPTPTNDEINQPTYQHITNKPMFFHRHYGLQWTITPSVLS
jgi:hypothetical protein